LISNNVSDAIQECAEKLEAAGVSYGHGTDSAWDEAAALVLGVTGFPDHVASLDREMLAAQQRKMNELLERRIQERIPLAYLLGRASFAGLDFAIEPGVVIPRSPIAELIQQRFEPWLARPPRQIIDLCCGSGCIGIAAAVMFPDSHLTLVDIDEQAIALSERNVVRHGLSDRTTIVRSDIWKDVPPDRFDLILSNPPYVDTTDMNSLPPEHRHEPALGLAGGENGLQLVNDILAGLDDRLSDAGLLVCEVGNSAPALLRAYPQLPFFWPDLEQGGEGVFLLMADAA
jgi:ribosomal protein L3 glutamine methyltransferase